MNEADIIYRTADGKRICITVTIAIKELLRLSERQMRSQRRQDRRRHTEYIDGLTDTTMVFPQEDFADLVLRMDRYKQLYSSIDELPKTQRRRLQLYYFAGMSQQENRRYGRCKSASRWLFPRRSNPQAKKESYNLIFLLPCRTCGRALFKVYNFHNKYSPYGP